MTLHDWDLANQTPASYRTDHNNLNLAAVSNSASSSGITTTFAHMWYADVSSSGWMRQRNAADSTFNYIYPLGVPGGLFTYAGNPSTNHAAKYQGQPLYDTSNNALYIATLAGTSSSATWAQVQFSSSVTSGYPTKYMQGLVPTYASAASFTISAGACRDDGDAANIAISTAYTVDITVSGAGGLSTSETESTSGSWYYCFAIRKSTDGTVNFILTASSSGAVMPSGYDQKRLLPFAVRNTTQANFIPWFVGEGWPGRPVIRYNLLFGENGGTVGGTNIVDGGTSTSFTDLTSITNYIPPISRLAFLRTSALRVSNEGNLYVRPDGETHNGYVFRGSGSSPTDQIIEEAIIPVQTSTAQMIEYKVDSGMSADIAVVGFTVTEA